MIKIVPKESKKTKKKITPHYSLEYNYMIGDANGYTEEEVMISKDNPFLERYVKLLNSLKPTKGRWGVVLTEERLKKHVSEKQITKDDFEFLKALMFEEGKSKFKISEEDEEYAAEFFEGVRAEAEYSFLVFEGVTLTYIDEYGEKFETKISKR